MWVRVDPKWRHKISVSHMWGGFASNIIIYACVYMFRCGNIFEHPFFIIRTHCRVHWHTQCLMLYQMHKTFVRSRCCISLYFGGANSRRRQEMEMRMRRYIAFCWRIYDAQRKQNSSRPNKRNISYWVVIYICKSIGARVSDLLIFIIVAC